MSILGNKNKLSLPTAIGLGTTILGAGGNVLSQLLGLGTRGENTEQNTATTRFRTFGGMRDNLFETAIDLPQFLSGSTNTSDTNTKLGVTESQTLRLYAESVNLPGVNIGTGETRRYGFGPNVRYAKDVSFNDVAVSFIGDGAGVILKVFSNWMNGIVKFDQTISPASGESTPFFFRYKKDYVAPQFAITVFNERRDEVAVYNLEDAFPTSISDINLNWGSTNQLARFTVNFTYTRWVHQSVTDKLVENLNIKPEGDSSVLSRLYQIGTGATAIASLGKPRNVGDVINVVSNAARLFK